MDILTCHSGHDPSPLNEVEVVVWEGLGQGAGMEEVTFSRDHQ